MISRRGFVGAAGAFALINGGCAFRAPSGMFGGGAKLRFGVISDVHLKEKGDDADLLKAPDFFLPLERKIAACEFRIPLSDLKLKGRYRFRAVPLESFGKKGRPIWSSVIAIS